MTDPKTRNHYECVLHSPSGARRVVHEYATSEAEALRLAEQTAVTVEFEVRTIAGAPDIDIFLRPTPPPPPGSYLLECFSCGLRGTTDDFGLGNNRKCPSCGSGEVHSSDYGRTT